MNEQLIKFIELCLADGIVSKKEREVIFKKAKKLGVDEDECEIILEGLISQHKEKVTEKKPGRSIKDVVLKESYLDLDIAEEWLNNLNKLGEDIKGVLQKENVMNFVKSGDFKNILKKSPYVHDREMLDYMISQPGNGERWSWWKASLVQDPNTGTFTLERELKNKIETILKEEEFWGYSAMDGPLGQQNKKDMQYAIRNKYDHVLDYSSIIIPERWGFAIFTNLGIHAFHRGHSNWMSWTEKYPEFQSYDKLQERDWNGSRAMHTISWKYLFAYETNVDIKSLFLNLKLSFDDNLFIETTSSCNLNDTDLSNIMRVHHYITKSIREHNQAVEKLSISHIYDVEKIIFDKYEWDMTKEIESLISYQKEFIILMTSLLMMRDNMLNCLIKSDAVNAKKILLQLEDLGVLETKFQRDLLDSLKEIGEQLAALNQNLLSMMDSLTDHLKSIDNNIGQQNDNLSEISGKLTYNNLISTISAYQLWKVNKNTKALN